MRKNLKIIGGILGVLLVTVWVADFFLPISYVARLGFFQAELLWGRVPINDALEDGQFSDEDRAKLRLVHEIKDYGQRVGFSATDNYDTINPSFKRTIWNVSACDPVSFTPKRWWFPIVGRVPYLGFFEKAEAEEAIQRRLKRAHEELAAQQEFDAIVINDDLETAVTELEHLMMLHSS